ncbi:hypothetical protein OAI87_01580 [Paracoccaceae bacterium]|nr:hypothetical protein [Paracoccaceae bacterium]
MELLSVALMLQFVYLILAAQFNFAVPFLGPWYFLGSGTKVLLFLPSVIGAVCGLVLSVANPRTAIFGTVFCVFFAIVLILNILAEFLKLFP